MVDVKVECNGENGHADDDDDPLADPEVGNGGPPAKKKRKSSAEKFLEDNSEYYGFQVLPSKLRSSSLDQSTFPNPFLDFLHRRSNSGDNEYHGAGISTSGITDADQKQQKEPHVS